MTLKHNAGGGNVSVVIQIPSDSNQMGVGVAKLGQTRFENALATEVEALFGAALVMGYVLGIPRLGLLAAFCKSALCNSSV
jgi:hypothetical protein